MTTLAESFLDDLDELGSDESDDEEPSSSNKSRNVNSSEATESKSDNEDEDSDDDDGDDNMITDSDLIQLVEAKVATSVGVLRASNRYKRVLLEVSSIAHTTPSMSTTIEGVLEEDPEYKLVLSCNKLAQDIDDEIASTYKYVVQLYAKKFPELATLIPNKLDYIKLVNRIGNETDLTLINMTDLIPPATVMSVSVMGSTTSGMPLNDHEIAEVKKACDEILQLDIDKGVILRFVASRMQKIAPNLCSLIGSRIAAQIIGLAGGVTALSKIPACNIQVMGQEKRNLGGLSNISSQPHVGILINADLVQEAIPSLRKKIMKIVAAKVALVARVDSYNNHPDGSEGERFRNEIQDRIEKLQTPSKARTKKALPIPEETKKSRRGGRRVRKMKERYAMTDLRKQQNRISFTIEGGEYGDSAMGVDAGMVGHKDTGKVRVTQKKEMKLYNPNKKPKKGVSVSSGQTSGLSSSLVFTPVQGIELVNPNAAAERVKEANNKWFSTYSGFLSAAPK